MYDIIGDIHGYSKPLVALLEKLGYQKRFGVYHHNSRKAIFLGDFVDRGPDVKGVLKIVKPMVEEKSAYTVIGNHEYNLVCFYTRGENGRFLRPHTPKNIAQIAKSNKAFEKSQKKLTEYLEWFKSLPIFLELDGIRVVHATWYQPDVDFLKEHYKENRLTDQLLHKSAQKGTKESEVIEHALKGVEVKMPKGLQFTDTDGNERKHMRIKWWEEPKGKTFRQLATREAHLMPNEEVPKKILPKGMAYPEEAPPLFLGHYCIPEDTPFLHAPNVCCVDFCVVKMGSIVAYRYNGETKLDNANFVV